VVLKLTSIVPVASEPDFDISVRAPRLKGVDQWRITFA
jgi:hypothetical protein